MKKLLKLFVVAALAVAMTLCCVACGGSYNAVTEENQEEVAQKFAEKIDKDAPIGSVTKDESGAVTKQSANLGAFLDLEADLTIGEVGIKGKTKDEVIILTSVDMSNPEKVAGNLGLKIKSEGSLTVTATEAQLGALMDKLGAISEDEGTPNFLPFEEEVEETEDEREVSPIERVIRPFLNKNLSENAEILLVDGVVYVNGKAETTGIKSEAKLSMDIKESMGGAENYASMIAFMLRGVYEEIDNAGAMVSDQSLMFAINMLSNLGFKVSVDLSNFSLKIEASEEFVKSIKEQISLSETDKLDFKTLALTLNVGKDGKISSAKLELNVEADMKLGDLAVKGTVKGALELKTEGLSISAPNANDYLEVTDIAGVLLSGFFAA